MRRSRASSSSASSRGKKPEVGVNGPHLTKRSLSAELKNVFTLEEIKAEVRCWKLFQNYVKERSHTSSKDNYFNPICGLCLAQPKEQKWLVKFRRHGLHRLNQFLMNSTRKEAQARDVKLLTWCCLSLLAFYYSKSITHVDDCNCFRMRKFEQSKVLFRGAMYLVLPEKQSDVIRQTIRYVTITDRWNSEDYDSFVLQELLTMITKPELLIAKIIKQVEKSQREMEILEAFNISCTLSTILEQVYWDKYLFNHLLHNCFNTLLKLYLLCSFPVPSVFQIDNARLRVVVKTCIRYFLSNIKDNKGLVSVMDSTAKCLHDPTIPNDDRVELTEMIAFCAQRHSTKYFRESITPDLLDLLLNDITSNDKAIAMLAFKIFHHLLDRHGNVKYFTEPVHFYKGRSDFTINYEYGIEDIHFFKSFSLDFFEGVHHCFLTFPDKYDLITCYTTLCLVLVEIPDPVITINIIHVVITTQNEILKTRKDIPMTAKAHLHAIVAAVMSLICVIHDEEVSILDKYVEEVIKFRVENSPQLLPPLQTKYSLASYHTTDYHDQLYFLEEEILYALQRCWLTRRMTGYKGLKPDSIN